MENYYFHRCVSVLIELFGKAQKLVLTNPALRVAQESEITKVIGIQTENITLLAPSNRQWMHVKLHASPEKQIDQPLKKDCWMCLYISPVRHSP